MSDTGSSCPGSRPALLSEEPWTVKAKEVGMKCGHCGGLGMSIIRQSMLSGNEMGTAYESLILVCSNFSCQAVLGFWVEPMAQKTVGNAVFATQKEVDAVSRKIDQLVYAMQAKRLI